MNFFSDLLVIPKSSNTQLVPTSRAIKVGPLPHSHRMITIWQRNQAVQRTDRLDYVIRQWDRLRPIGLPA